jgi:uncharacterized protein
MALREGASSGQALDLLSAICSMSQHEFWADDLGYAQVPMSGVIGHRQVTDAYLAQLARQHHGRLATMDAGLSAQHPDVAAAVPTRS